ncbi:MAG: hypothetical protein NUV74_05285 [Candidatus Brocadiaceae bacterium]|nr:hypothetical protein [Candidatus Brocadiaceae bacterium]
MEESEKQVSAERVPLECKVMRNRYGDIKTGTKVWFTVENASQWCGSTEGILDHDGNEFVIRTKKGIVTINKGYDAYSETIKPAL